MRRLDVIAVLVLLVGIAASAIGSGLTPKERRPTPDFQNQGERASTLAPSSDEDPSIEMRREIKASDVSGTAFAIAPGVWMSAEHVTESCSQLLVEVEGRFMRGGNLVEHPTADVSIFRTSGSGPALPLSATLDPGQTGFHHGYPSGKPGDVLSSLIGRARVRVSGAVQRIAPVVVWSESQRFPRDIAELGGISGGPTLDAEGRVVGVTIGGSKRRGTVITAAPVSMREVVAQADARPLPARGPNLRPSPNRVVEYGNTLRRDLSVAKVVCLTKPRSRRPLSRR